MRQLTETAGATQPAAGGLPLAACGLDGFETALLPLLRHFMISLQQPGTQFWQHAFKIAAERWGSTFGLAAAQALFEVIRGVHGHRGAAFACHDPFRLETRQNLTADEAAFLQMIHSMRRDRTPAARVALAGVMAGRLDPDVIRAGLSFARRFPAGQGAQPPAAGGRLRVVG
ncbi:hypothetical protein ACUXV3_16080 [Roseobacteraceae bacterium NS-SX3]